MERKYVYGPYPTHLTPTFRQHALRLVHAGEAAVLKLSMVALQIKSSLTPLLSFFSRFVSQVDGSASTHAVRYSEASGTRQAGLCELAGMEHVFPPQPTN